MQVNLRLDDEVVVLLDQQRGATRRSDWIAALIAEHTNRRAHLDRLEASTAAMGEILISAGLVNINADEESYAALAAIVREQRTKKGRD